METTKYMVCCIHGSLKREETQQVTSTILYNKKWNLVAITKYTLFEKKNIIASDRHKIIAIS